MLTRYEVDEEENKKKDIEIKEVPMLQVTPETIGTISVTGPYTIRMPHITGTSFTNTIVSSPLTEEEISRALATWE